MTRICIVAAKRTPQGRFLGALAKRSAVDLAVAAGRAALSGIDPAAIDQVILGCVVQAGLGMNVARQVGVGLGLPIDRPAFTVNMMCASGLQAVSLAAQAIKAGDARAVLCGGTESMSNAPYLLERARSGYKLGDGTLVDSLLRDGLTDAFDREHMAHSAERLAGQFKISRQQQDSFALRSQQRAADAIKEGVFRDEIIELEELKADEHPRGDTTLDKLASLKPAFDKAGTITAGNASGINDGAAILLVCDEGFAKQKGWRPLAFIGGWSAVGCDPRMMGLGPVHATRKLCASCSGQVNAFDAVEINEAFAAQALACLSELKLDETRVNPHGGAIALGHPIGASGARLVTHLAHRVSRGEVKRGLATLCVGGGMGVAMSVEKVS